MTNAEHARFPGLPGTYGLKTGRIIPNRNHMSSSKDGMLGVAPTPRNSMILSVIALSILNSYHELGHFVAPVGRSCQLPNLQLVMGQSCLHGLGGKTVFVLRAFSDRWIYKTAMNCPCGARRSEK